MRHDRKQAVRRGRRAERFACLALMLKGYHLLAKDLRTPSGEIDLIMRKGQLVAFIEVKARETRQEAIEAVSLRQKQRIFRAAELWMSRKTVFAHMDWRFDIVAVTPFAWPTHYLDAWRP